ncbi:MAG: recombinase family protein, partial [Bacteroidetes bacterium]|nr:recombinase family protein [Bacteroidota bacterium]
MSRKAILYTRVSTDEQAMRGYSLNDQYEKLKAYCMIHKIDAVEHFQDDHSAKSFDRPAFRRLIEFLKHNKHAADLLLFIKWDRFSRNATESYEMLRTLKRYNVEAQATEQPLNLSIPESKLMLALFLASPEVENDRRSLNTSMGMRRALKEGRWVVRVPMGYGRKRDEHNKPIIVPGDGAKLIKEAFELIASGEYSQDSVRKKMNAEGVRCSKNNFSCLLRNPVYMGKIKLKATKEDGEEIVQGLHEPIVDEETFSIVQDILEGRRVKNNVAKIHSAKPELPLRGFLECPRCGSKLTGSASKGHGGRYFYYHCGKGCKERFRATLANEKFVELLEEIQPDHNAIDLYDAILKEILSENENRRKETAKTTEVEIRKIQERINSLQDKLADNQINIADYNSAKQRYDAQLRELTEKKANQIQLSRDIYQQLVFSFSFLKDLPSKYRDANIGAQQQIIGSIFPGKLVFQENKVRTS